MWDDTPALLIVLLVAILAACFFELWRVERMSGAATREMERRRREHRALTSGEGVGSPTTTPGSVPLRRPVPQEGSRRGTRTSGPIQTQTAQRMSGASTREVVRKEKSTQTPAPSILIPVRDVRVTTVNDEGDTPRVVHEFEPWMEPTSEEGRLTYAQAELSPQASVRGPSFQHDESYEHGQAGHGATEDCDAMGSSLLTAALQQYYASIEASPQEASAHTEEERPLPSSDHSGRAQEQVPRRRAHRDIHKDKSHSEW